MRNQYGRSNESRRGFRGNNRQDRDYDYSRSDSSRSDYARSDYGDRNENRFSNDNDYAGGYRSQSENANRGFGYDSEDSYGRGQRYHAGEYDRSSLSQGDRSGRGEYGVGAARQNEYNRRNYGMPAANGSNNYGTNDYGSSNSSNSHYGVYDVGGQGASGYRSHSNSYDRKLENSSGGWNERYRAGDREPYYPSNYEDSHHHDSSFFERMGEKIGEFFGKGPKGYRRSDERIREDISEALYRHSYIDASDVEVTVSDAHVTLTGTVRDRGTKRMIEDEAERVSGVKDVTNNIRLADSSSSSSSTTSTDLTARTNNEDYRSGKSGKRQ